MPRYPAVSDLLPRALDSISPFPTRRSAIRRIGTWLIMGLALAWGASASAVILWSSSGPTLVRETGPGNDVIHGAVGRDDSAVDTLYFKFRVEPISDADTEEYFAAFELFEADIERLGVGNALKAWAYSAFLNTDDTGATNKVVGYIDLHSANPSRSEAGGLSNYELPRRGHEVTIVFKVQYVPGGNDLVTVWLDPDLGPGATEVYQPENLTTRFSVNASFDEIRLRHSGRGEGWTFGEMAIATSFTDFVNTSSARPGGTAAATLRGALSFSFRSWQREQGLPPTSIRSLAQTSDGYLWVGTDDGVARFDGVRFTTFGPQEGLRGGPVRSLLGDASGALWIGTANGGLSRRFDGSFTTFTRRDGLPSDSVTALTEDHEGRIWVGTDAGLVCWKNGQFMPLAGADDLTGKAITALFCDRSGTMWLGATAAGVFRFQTGQLSRLQGDSVDDLLLEPHCLLVDQTEHVWIGAGSDFLLSRDGDQWHRHRIARRTSGSSVSALAEDPDGTIWVGSASGGLFQFKAGKLEARNAGSGLSDNLVESLLIDRDGKLWVGTDSGLNRLRRKPLLAFGQNEGLGFGPVQGLAELANGVFWAGKPGDGLYRWEGRSFSRLMAAGLSTREPPVQALLAGRDGSCWVADGNGLLHFKDPTAAADEVKRFDFGERNIISLSEDRDGSLLAGTRAGRVWRLSRGLWTSLTNYSQAHPITAIVPAEDGTVWLGTQGGGLCQFQRGLATRFDKRNGLSSDIIQTLYLDAENTLWIGTGGGGLSRWRQGKVSTFTIRDGLPDNAIAQILEDDAQRLWLGTSRGIACVRKRELDDLAAGLAPAIFPLVYGVSEGMLAEECTTGFSPAGLKTRSGLLWFSTAKGIVVADPQLRSTNAAVPRILLEEVRVDGLPQPELKPAGPVIDRTDRQTALAGPAPDVLRIPPGKHSVEFRYTGLSFDAPEQISFRYRLEGLDPDWVEAGTRRAAFYSFVPPGQYRFHVIGRSRDGVWDQGGADFPLSVSRHFWQTWWFLGLSTVVLLTTFGGAVRLVEKGRMHRRLKVLEQERALERERTRIARDLHDEMGAKLCRISFLSEHVRRGPDMPESLRHQISSISDASREVLHSLDEIVWAVNPQNDLLEHVASYLGQYADEYFQMTGIECELDIPAHLPPHPLSSQSRHHLFLAAHEAFTNILKHSGATRARVSMACTPSSFDLTVWDNGRGLDPVLNPARTEGAAAGSGNGIRNMRQRLSDIGGVCQIDSDSKGGTTIRFSLPLTRLAPN